MTAQVSKTYDASLFVNNTNDTHTGSGHSERLLIKSTKPLTIGSLKNVTTSLDVSDQTSPDTSHASREVFVVGGDDRSGKMSFSASLGRVNPIGEEAHTTMGLDLNYRSAPRYNTHIFYSEYPDECRQHGLPERSLGIEYSAPFGIARLTHKDLGYAQSSETTLGFDTKRDYRDGYLRGGIGLSVVDKKGESQKILPVGSISFKKETSKDAFIDLQANYSGIWGGKLSINYKF